MGSKKCRNMMFSTQIDKVSYKDAQVTYDYFMNYLTKQPEQIAVILHDKDTDEDGTIIKPHIHVMMRFENARSIDQVAKELLQPPQTIEAWNDNYNNGFSYLIHETATAEHKFKYDPEEVVANFNFKKRILEIRALAKSNFRENQLSGKIINSLIDEIKDGTKTKEEVEAVIPGSKLARYKIVIDTAYDHFRRNEQQKWRDKQIKKFVVCTFMVKLVQEKQEMPKNLLKLFLTVSISQVHQTIPFKIIMARKLLLLMN